MNNLAHYWENIINMLAFYAPKFFLAIFILFLGLWIIKKLVKLIDKIMSKRNVDKSLHTFFKSLLSVGLKLLLIVSVISMAGIETTSFVAILASAGFAVGMALQGSLSNFAGGILILTFKPYKVSDYILAQSYEGTVQSIQIFNTILLTPDNKRISIPNGILSNGAIVNFTAENKRRLDLVFGIGYSDDIDKARGILLRIIENDERIYKEPAPFTAVGKLGASSVDFTVRVWCDTSEYWNIHFDLLEKVKKEFDASSISIPFPQSDVHIYQHQ
jgi:small conductance mechanosensitive channel